MNLSTINPLTLPSLPLTERSHLPKCTAIYFALSDEEIFYIGRTTNLRQRWTVHHLLKQLLSKKLVRVAWLECSDTNLLPEIEAALIEYFQPCLNGRNAQREQDLVRLYLPVDLKERFKLYCQLKGTTMTEVIKEQIQKLIDSENLSELLEERLNVTNSPKLKKDNDIK